MKRATVATATLLGILSSFKFLTAEAARQTPATTIQQARRMLETNSDGKKLGNIDLTAVNHSWEVGLGQGIRAIVVSTNYGGGIAMFSPDGVMESSMTTGKAESVELFDLNGSGVSQILTDEVTEWGTGIVIKNFRLYALNGRGMKKVWTGLSYKVEAPWQPDQTKIKVQLLENFIRFDEAGTGHPGRMTYLTSTGTPGRFRKVEYVMTGLAVHELSGSEVKK